MITIDDKEYRNLQEQVAYLTEQLTQIKQSLGSALPDPIEGPQGPQGEPGTTGPQGRTPRIGFGFGPLPVDDSFQDGDIYIVRGSSDIYNLKKGNVYKKVNGYWELQLNIMGSQGPVGQTGEVNVIPNYGGEPSGNLDDLNIDGVTYTVLSENDRKALGLIGWDGSYPYLTTYPFTIDTQLTLKQNVTIKNTVVMNYQSGSVCMFGTGSILRLANLGIIQRVNGSPWIIVENFADFHGNKRFVEGLISTPTISGVTFTYAKWSLSGTHLMLVLCGEISANTTLSVDTWGVVTLPDYIKNKIFGVFASTNIEVKDSRAYYDDWNSINIQTVLQKTDDGVQILMIQNTTSVSTSHFRIQFDLLIDMTN